MAGANKIQLLRGTQAEKTASTATLLAGQPLYITDTNYLCVGNGSSTVRNAVPIKASYANSSGSASSATTALSVQNSTVRINSTDTDIYLNATRSVFMNSGVGVNICATTMNIVAEDNVYISAVGDTGNGRITLSGLTYSTQGIMLQDGYNVQVGEVGNTAKYTATSIIRNNSYTLTLPLETGTLATQAWVNSHAGGGTVDIQVTENSDGTVNLIFP